MMEKDQIRPFLYRVATDAAYRSRLEADPVATLAELGITLDPADIPAGGIHLPPNDEILAKLDELTAKFESLIPVNWDIPELWQQPI
jgi:hypothetical protein